eukprot:gene20560-biopygen20611
MPCGAVQGWRLSAAPPHHMLGVPVLLVYGLGASPKVEAWQDFFLPEMAVFYPSRSCTAEQQPRTHPFETAGGRAHPGLHPLPTVTSCSPSRHCGIAPPISGEPPSHAPRVSGWCTARGASTCSRWWLTHAPWHTQHCPGTNMQGWTQCTCFPFLVLPCPETTCLPDFTRPPLCRVSPGRAVWFHPAALPGETRQSGSLKFRGNGGTRPGRVRDAPGTRPLPFLPVGVERARTDGRTGGRAGGRQIDQTTAPKIKQPRHMDQTTAPHIKQPRRMDQTTAPQNQPAAPNGSAHRDTPRDAAGLVGCG